MVLEDAIRKLICSQDNFPFLSTQELDELLNIMERQEYVVNQTVFSIEDAARYFYLVEKGLFILNLRGGRIKTFKPGDIFGEIAVINENVRTGTIRAMENSTLLAFNGHKLFDAAFISPETALKITRALAIRVTNYLRSREQISTKELIEQGENDIVEFKTSLRWNMEKEHKDKLIEHAVLKALAAFLNTKGGTLLIGVRDDKEIVGIGQDRFENYDKMLLHLTRLVKEYIGPLYIEFLKFEIEQIDKEHVLRIDCDAATLPAYVKEKYDDAFYVRTGPSTTHLKVSRIYDYIRMRFH